MCGSLEEKFVRLGPAKMYRFMPGYPQKNSVVVNPATFWGHRHQKNSFKGEDDEDTRRRLCLRH